MYQVKCDDYILYDPRDDDLYVLNPKCALSVNSVCEASFTILKNHQFYSKLRKLRSVVEIKDDNHILFRGRITNDSLDFYNCMKVDCEGALAFANDSIIPPFNFPDDFSIPSGENVVRILLGWFISKHNEQVQDFQKLKLGTVTVTDPNNYISRSSEKYISTWDALKGKLFDSSLGGFMYARYEEDGTYIDYVKEFEYTNTQKIDLTENVLDLESETDASETYSAMLPMGAEIEVPEEKDENGDTIRESYSYRLTLEGYPDGEITDDFVKNGVFIYSKKAIEKYGWVCAPIDDTTWDDVTVQSNLRSKAVEWLGNTGVLLKNTITIKAIDLHLTNDEIQAFRAFRNVVVNSKPHEIDNKLYPLTAIEIDLFNPQNTEITVGDTRKTLIDMINDSTSAAIERVEKAAEIAEGAKKDNSTIKQQILNLETNFISTAQQIIFEAMRDYVETGDFESYRESVSTQLQLLADSFNISFSKVTEDIENVDGDLQNKYNEITKYIKFDLDGITIGSDESPLKLTLDNGMIKFEKNGQTIAYWDGDYLHTGNIVVEVDERAQFGDFAFIPRSDGSLMFLKVGGESSGSSGAGSGSGSGGNTGNGGSETNRYTVSSVPGAYYSFEVGQDGYYVSQNKGRAYSLALCRVNFDYDTAKTVVIHLINYAEESYDYGVLGNIDDELSISSTEDTSHKWSGKNKHSTEEQTVTYTMPSGQHFIDIKYLKDGSNDSGYDCLMFRVEVL